MMREESGLHFYSSEQLMQVSFDAIQDGICVLDGDLNILRVNRCLEEWYEETMPVTGKKCYQVFQGQEYLCDKCPAVKTLRTGEPAVEVVSITRARGVEGWIELYSYPLKSEAGEIKGVVEFMRNITEEVRIKKALEESEEKYRALIEQSVDMIYLHEIDGSIIEVNRAAAEWTGYSKEELCRMNVFDLYPEPHPDVGIREDVIWQWRSWEPMSGACNIETAHKRKDGSIAPVSINTGKVKIGNRELILALVRDRTGQLKAEEAMRYQYRYESMVADISSKFVNASAEDIDRAIDHALALSSTAIPVECRILAIVDAFDAMTHRRPYNRTMSKEEAVKELKDNAGAQFDPGLVEVFISILTEKSQAG